MALSSKIDKEEGTEDDKKTLEDLNKKAAKLQKESTTMLPPNFMNELDNKLISMSAYEESEEGGSDSVLTYRCLKNESDIICSKDTDFVLLAGQR
eukprot:6851789-Ditylum_brightwellii.AAC.1